MSARRVVVGLVLAMLTTVGWSALPQGPAQAWWTSTSAAGGTGSGAATSVKAGTRPTVSASGSSVSVSWSATTMTSGAAVTGYVVTRYDTNQNAIAAASACAGTITATSCTESGVPDGTWQYTITPAVGTNWRGDESALSTSVLVDATGPSSTFSLSSVSGGASISGTTVYYNSTSAGSFKLTNTATDAGSGATSSATASLSGTSTGWSHTASTVSTPTGGPYVSNAFSWTAGTTSSPTETVTTTDAYGNATTTTLTFLNDSSAPSGTITYADGYSSGRSVSVSYSTSGGATSAQIQRARASLKNGVCGTYGAFANIGSANPTSPYVDGPNTSGACYKYQLVVADSVNNTATITSTNVAKIGYAGAVLATTSLISYWRFGDNGTVSSDSFSGTTGVALQDRTGEIGATWTRHPTSALDAVLTASGRARKEGSGTYALYSASGQPATADYRVSATVVDQSIVIGDRACVVGRLDPTAATYYSACYEQTSGAYTLNAVSSGTLTPLGSSVQSFPAGASHRLALDLSGTTIRLLVDGNALVSATDSSITATGSGGLLLGSATVATDLGDSAGLQLDDFVVGRGDTVPAAADAKGSNSGVYVNGPTLGQTGAIAGDSDTAASFDGTDDYMQVKTPSGLPTGASARTVEIWFKTTASTRQVLFTYGTPSTNQEFGLWLNSSGTSMTAWGKGADPTFSLNAAVNDGAWHQAVVTYDGATLVLYVDGVSVGSQAVTRNTVIDSSGLTVGAVVEQSDSNNGGYFKGALDEVSFFSSALSASAVSDHYNLANPVQDIDGPTGGSVDGTNLVGTGGRYRNTTSLTLGLSKGTDASGVATTGAQLLRASATLSYGTCGAYTSFSLLATDPATPYATSVSSAKCYRYKYVVADSLGNQTTYASPSIKVDTSAAGTPGTPSYSALSNAYGSSTTVYYRSQASSGSITLAPTSSDKESNIASYTFPSLGTGWTSTPGAAINQNTYSWTAPSPAAPGAKSITATNNAALTGSGRSITFTADDTGPSGGSLSYTNGKVTTTTTSISLSAGTDSQSGVKSTKTIQASTAPAAGGVCGTFGAFATVGTTTSTTAYTASLTQDYCYMFQLIVSDNVGNTTTYTSSSIVRRAAAYASTVTSTSGVLDFWRLGEASGSASAADSATASTTNNGTYSGSPTLGVSGAIFGDANTAATFDGSTQFVTALRGLTGTNFSIELWFSTTSTTGGTSASWSGNAALVDADTSGAASDFGISLTSDGKVTAGLRTSTGADTTVTSQAGLNDGQWHQVVFTRASTGALVLYVDGTQVATATGGTGTLAGSASLVLARASSGAQRFYSGSLDDVSTYNTTPLSAATVTAHYNAAK